MRAIVENANKVEINYEGIKIIETRDNKIVDEVILQSFEYNVEENAHELASEIIHQLYGFLKDTYNTVSAKKHIKQLLEEVADETLGQEILCWSKED